ncbi:MAG: hypothetical protein PW792_14515 [Acidobacteriaceae bacterium]|nr:hypothetical protein [Acidobacteriaceae bacterium]
MFKKIVSVFLQMLLFLVVFGVGSFLPAVGALPMWRTEVGTTRYFVFDGLVLMLVLYVLIAAIEAARKRFRALGLTTLAMALALALGLAMKFGFVTKSGGF